MTQQNEPCAARPLVRLALEGEEEAFVELARRSAAEGSVVDRFNEDRCRETFRRYIDDGDFIVFVAEHERELVGFSLATWEPNALSDGFYAEQRVLYVSPEQLGSGATEGLIKALIDRVRQPGVGEIYVTLATAKIDAREISFMREIGFEPAGTTFVRPAPIAEDA